MITISNEAEVVRGRLIRELEELSQKERLSRQEERRFDALKVQIKQVSSGMSPSELVGSDVARLEDELRGINLRGMIPTEAEQDWRSFINGRANRSYGRPVKFELRATAQEVGSQSIAYSAGVAGGYFVPVGYQDRQLDSMKTYDELWERGNHAPVNTDTGAPLQLPNLDDVANASVLVNENQNPGPQPLVSAGVTSLGAYSFRSGLIYCSIETLADTSLNIGSILERAMAVRAARGIGPYLVNGTHVGQPGGLIEAGVLTENITYAAGAAPNTGIAVDTGASSIGTQDVMNVFFKLNRAYRREASWCMTDDTFLAISNLLDKMGRPIVRYNAAMTDVATIYSRPIVICPSMQEIGVNANPLAFYVPRYFLLRRVARGSYVQMATEAPGTAESGSVAFQGWARVDSALAVPNASYPPISVLQNLS